MKTYWGLEPLFIFDMGRGENFNEWLLCVSETMLWVHLSCSGAVGWGTLAAKHEWDEWNHLWQTDTGARAWVIQQNAVPVCISISFDINSYAEWLNIQIHALQMANNWFGKGHYLVLHSCILNIVKAKRQRESNCCQVGLRPVKDCRDQTRPKHGSMKHSFIHFLGLSKSPTEWGPTTNQSETRFITTHTFSIRNLLKMYEINPRLSIFFIKSCEVSKYPKSKYLIHQNVNTLQFVKDVKIICSSEKLRRCLYVLTVALGFEKFCKCSHFEWLFGN